VFLLPPPVAAQGSRVATQEHDHFWVSESVFISPPAGVREVHDVLCQDVNGDGRLDRLYAHPDGLTVEFGDSSPSGWSDPIALALPPLTGFPTEIFPSAKFLEERAGAHTPWSMDGELNRDLLPAFWCRWKGPDRVFGFRIEGRRVLITQSVQLSPKQLVDVTERGLVYGPDGDGKIYLDEYGVRRVLTSNVPPLDWMKWADADGDGQRDLIVKKRSGGLGIIRSSKGRMLAQEWLDQTEMLKHWFFLREEDGRLSILGRFAGSNDDFKWSLGKDQRWSADRLEHDSWFDDLTMVKAEEVGNGYTYTLAASRHWRTTVGAVWRHGECLGRFELEHSDVLGDPHFSDLNGDGLLDFVFWDERAGQLVCHYLLQHPDEMGVEGNVAELVMLDTQDSSAIHLVKQRFLSQIQPDEQLAVLESLKKEVAGTETIKLSSGSFEVCGEAFCQQLKPALSLMPPGEPNDENCAHTCKLSVPSSRRQSVAGDRSTCLDSAGWNHIVYTRNDRYESKLYINNELASEGKDRELDLGFKILNIGAEGGNSPHRFLHGDVDELEIVHAVLPTDEIASRFEARSIMPHPKTVVAFDFDENPNRLFPFGTDELKINGGCEVISGVHGSGLRLDGESGRATSFVKIPSDNFSISLWLRPRVGKGDMTRPGTAVSLYGKRNFELEVLPPNRSGVYHRPKLKMANAIVEKPEDGVIFSSRGDRYFLSKSGSLFTQTGFDWRELNVPGGQDQKTIQGRPWFAEDGVNAFFGRNLTHMVLDLESLGWTEKGRLNSILGDVVNTLHAHRGTLVITSNANADLNAFWWPINSDKLFRVQMPASAEPIVAVMNALGRFVWVHASGKESGVRLDAGAVPLPAYQNDLPVWAWFAGGVVFLLLGAGTWRAKKTQRDLAFAGAVSASDPHQEETFVPNPLPVHPDVLQLLYASNRKDFDVQSLEEAFLIGDIETDETRRSRRARMIKDLNAWWEMRQGCELIVRDVDESDKRRRVYKFDPGFAKWFETSSFFNAGENPGSSPEALH
jgi:hypothetical protein